MDTGWFHIRFFFPFFFSFLFFILPKVEIAEQTQRGHVLDKLHT